MLENTASERVLERASFVRGITEVEPDGLTVTRWSRAADAEPTRQVTYATVGYDREMTTVGSGRPSAASTGAPREVAIPDEPLTAALDRAVDEYGDRIAVDFLGRTTTYAALGDHVSRAAGALLGARRAAR